MDECGYWCHEDFEDLLDELPDEAPALEEAFAKPRRFTRDPEE